MLLRKDSIYFPFFFLVCVYVCVCIYENQWHEVKRKKYIAFSITFVKGIADLRGKWRVLLYLWNTMKDFKLISFFLNLEIVFLFVEIVKNDYDFRSLACICMKNMQREKYEKRRKGRKHSTEIHNTIPFLKVTE